MHSILNLSMNHYLILSAIIVGIGVMGIFINSRNILMTLMSIELILLGVNFNFVIFARYLNDVHGQIFVFFVLTVAAVESAIGLAIIVLMYRIKRTIRIQDIDNLKG